jgi:hypothetical protein
LIGNDGSKISGKDGQGQRLNLLTSVCKERIPQQDREKFVEYMETELLHPREGNFARFMVSPAEFKR